MADFVRGKIKQDFDEAALWRWRFLCLDRGMGHDGHETRLLGREKGYNEEQGADQAFLGSAIYIYVCQLDARGRLRENDVKSSGFTPPRVLDGTPRWRSGTAGHSNKASIIEPHVKAHGVAIGVTISSAFVLTDRRTDFRAVGEAYFVAIIEAFPCSLCQTVALTNS